MKEHILRAFQATKKSRRVASGVMGIILIIIGILIGSFWLFVGGIQLNFGILFSTK